MGQGGWVVRTGVAFAHMADARKTSGCTDTGTMLCQCTRVHSGPADHVDFLDIFGRRSKELASNIFEAKFQGTLGLVRTIVNKSGILQRSNFWQVVAFPLIPSIHEAPSQLTAFCFCRMREVLLAVFGLCNQANCFFVARERVQEGLQASQRVATVVLVNEKVTTRNSKTNFGPWQL